MEAMAAAAEAAAAAAERGSWQCVHTCCWARQSSGRSNREPSRWRPASRRRRSPSDARTPPVIGVGRPSQASSQETSSGHTSPVTLICDENVPTGGDGGGGGGGLGLGGGGGGGRGDGGGGEGDGGLGGGGGDGDGGEGSFVVTGIGGAGDGIGGGLKPPLSGPHSQIASLLPPKVESQSCTVASGLQSSLISSSHALTQARPWRSQKARHEPPLAFTWTRAAQSPHVLPSYPIH
eukprot:scaffold27211_cov63-Phaeocystis_antarctica.AAC.1